MDKINIFKKGNPICDELERLGYVPPHCHSVTINLQAHDVPIVTIEAYGSDDLAAWIQGLQGAGVILTVLDLSKAVGRTPETDS